jgi:AraC family transcriptional regulator
MGEEKHILTGIEHALPEKHVWCELSGYSLYWAEQPNTFWHEHSHSCTQITVALDPAYIRSEWRGLAGSAQNRELSGDCISVVPPGIAHSTFWNRRADLVNMYLDDDFFRRAAQDSLGGTLPNLSPSFLVRDPFLVEMAKALRRESELGEMTELFIESIGTVMAVHLFRTYGDKAGIFPEYRGGLGPARERKVRAYIEEHLHTALALEDLAAVADVSQNYFVSLFRQSVGMTPHRYVLQQRVERAAALLTQPQLPLVDIGFRCGFLDQSQFTTTFRKFLGVTPGQYRKML